MSQEPDVEKRKKKRRRSARVYISNAHPLPSPEQLAALMDQFPSDEDEDTSAVAKPDRAKRDIGAAERKRLAAEGRAVVNPDGHVSYPVDTHEDAENALALIRSGHGDTAAATAMLRRVARKEGWQDIVDALKDPARKAATGIPADTYDGHPFADRVSPPLGPGHAAYGTGDHGAARGAEDPMNRPGPRELAYRHASMRQGTTEVMPLLRMLSVNGDNEFGDRDITRPVGMVGLARLNAAGATGLASAPGNPASRLMPHIAQGSATPPNGSHGLADPACQPPASMKASDRVAIVRQAMFGNGAR